MVKKFLEIIPTVLASPTTNHHQQHRVSKACNSKTCLKIMRCRRPHSWRLLNSFPPLHFIWSWLTQTSQLRPHSRLQPGWMGRWEMRLSSHSWSQIQLYASRQVLHSEDCAFKLTLNRNSGILLWRTEKGLPWRQELKSMIFKKEMSRESFPPCNMKSPEMTRNN